MIQDLCVVATVLVVIGDMEKIAVKVDDIDTINEGSSALSDTYKKLGRPYMCDFVISSSITYQFIYEPINVQTSSRSWVSWNRHNL